MDAEEIARLVEELKLTKDATTLQVKFSTTGGDTQQNEMRKLLVGKVFFARVVNREALRFQVPKILQLRRAVDIDIVGDNLFVIVFNSEDDHRHALLEGPCNFFNSLMVFKKPTGLQNPQDILFDEVSMWIQVHNLPFICMNPKYVRRIGSQVGKVEEVDVGEDGGCLGQFAKVRIFRPIIKPLQRCVCLEEEASGEARIVIIRYEKLTDFCYACGRVGHVLRYCNDETMDKGSITFGSWLRATRVVEARRPQKSTLGVSRGRGRFARGGMMLHRGYMGEEEEDKSQEVNIGQAILEDDNPGEQARANSLSLQAGMINEAEKLIVTNISQIRTDEEVIGVAEGGSIIEESSFSDKHIEVFSPLKLRKAFGNGRSWVKRAREKKENKAMTSSDIELDVGQKRVRGSMERESRQEFREDGGKKLKFVEGDNENLVLAITAAADLQPRRAS